MVEGRAARERQRWLVNLRLVMCLVLVLTGSALWLRSSRPSTVDTPISVQVSRPHDPSKALITELAPPEVIPNPIVAGPIESGAGLTDEHPLRSLLIPHDRSQSARAAVHANKVETALQDSSAAPPLDTAGLKQALEALLATTSGTYQVSVVDLTTGQELDIGSDEPTDAASVNKMEIMAAVFHEAELGHLSLQDRVTITASDMQNYGTGVIRYQPAGAAYSIQDLVKLMIEQSDNTASYVLAQRLGVANIDALIRQWGLKVTDVGPDVSTARDAARFLTLLYRRKLATESDTAKMLDYLAHTQWNSRIPAGVPSSIVVAHKIGNQVNVENDAGIVLLPQRPYVLTIFSSGVPGDAADPVEQQISRTVYTFEQRAQRV
ncbi:MAG: class A beta-lactamase-related serine hydrolase [Chloroflexi bacterium]|nr:class A beta-lactamase-related serine hydrolase [Chloroflexota bacterium]